MGLGVGGWVGCPLSWLSLPPNPDHTTGSSSVRARGRHAALWLPGVQLQARGGCGLQLQRERDRAGAGLGQVEVGKAGEVQGRHGRRAARVVGAGVWEGEERGGVGGALGGEDSEERLSVDGLLQPWDAGTVVPGLSSVLLVFGGVSGETWLADVQAVTITRTGEEGCGLDVMECTQVGGLKATKRGLGVLECTQVVQTHTTSPSLTKPHH